MTSPDRPDPPVVERVAAAPPARKRGALQALHFLSPCAVSVSRATSASRTAAAAIVQRRR